MSLHHYEFELLLFEHWNIEPYIFGMPSDTVLHSSCQKTSGCIRFCQITFTIMLKDTKNKGNNLNLMKVYREQKRTNERSWERERERESKNENVTIVLMVQENLTKNTIQFWVSFIHCYKDSFYEDSFSFLIYSVKVNDVVSSVFWVVVTLVLLKLL